MLSYSRKTTHVKLDKAVIGRVEQQKKSWLYIPFRFHPTVLEAPTLEELLKKVRQEHGN